MTHMLRIVLSLSLLLSTETVSLAQDAGEDNLDALLNEAVKLAASSASRSLGCSQANHRHLNARSANKLLSFRLTGYCLKESIGTHRPPSGSQYLIVEGKLRNLSESKSMTVALASSLLRLNWKAGMVLPETGLDSVLAPTFTSRPLPAYDSRSFAVAFIVPAEQATWAQVVHPGAAGILSMPLFGTPPDLSQFLSDPINYSGLGIGLISLEEPSEFDGNKPKPGHHFQQLLLGVTNRGRQPLQIQLDEFSQLVEDGSYTYRPLNKQGGAKPVSEFIPGLPLEVPLVFEVPEKSGHFSLALFGAKGRQVLAVTPSKKVPEQPLPLVGPEAAGHMKMGLLGVRAGQEEASLILDVQLELKVDEPVATLPMVPSKVMELHDRNGRVYRAKKDAGGMRRPFGSTELWPGQPVRGELTFTLEEGASELSLVLPVSGNPVRLSLPEKLVAKLLDPKAPSPGTTAAPSPVISSAAPSKKTAPVVMASSIGSGAQHVKSTGTKSDTTKPPVRGKRSRTHESPITIAVSLYGEAFDGYPEYEILADGKKIGSGVVDWAQDTVKEGKVRDKRVWVRKEIQALMKPEFPNRITIRFSNDKADHQRGGDRNLYVEYVEVDGRRISATSPYVSYTNIPGQRNRKGQSRMPWRGDLVFDFSIPEDIANKSNIAKPSQGGVIAHTSLPPEKSSEVGDLFRNITRPWIVTQSAKTVPSITFAFNNTQVVLIEEISLGAGNTKAAGMRPKRVLVEISTGHNPLGEYRKHRVYDLYPDRKWQTLLFDEPVFARFLRLTVLENFGAKQTVIGQVRVHEANRPGYESITTKGRKDVVVAKPGGKYGSNRISVVMESEPNDGMGIANVIESGKKSLGTIDPDTDVDVFALDTTPYGDAFLKLRLEGEPTVKVDLKLKDARGKLVAHKGASEEPATLVGPFNVQPGKYFIEITQAGRANMVMVFDSSGSMSGRLKDLSVAADQYLAEKRSNEAVKLIDFDFSVKTLSKFTTDATALRDSLKGKLRDDGGTSVYDALNEALNSVKERPGERAIILLSDGEDTHSKKSLWNAWEAIKAANVRVYTVGLGKGLLPYLNRLGAPPARILEFWANSSGGKYFHAPTSKELVGIYKKISAELQTRPKYSLTPSVVPAGKLRVVASKEMLPSREDPIIELVLDASGSMKERKRKIDGRLKIDVAKDVLKELIQSLPDRAVVGLRFYGHRIRERQRGDCKDTELVHPVSKIDRELMLSKVEAVKALGTTPLMLSVASGLQDLARANLRMRGKPRKMVVILVTDGKEECLRGRTVTQAAQQLMEGVNKINKTVGSAMKLKLDLRFNVVGFALADLATKADMAQAAAISGGRFYDAQDTASLASAIRNSFGDVPYEVINSEWNFIGRSSVDGEAIKVPAGLFKTRILKAGTPLVYHGVRVSARRQTMLDVQKSGNDIRIQTTIAGQAVDVPSQPQSTVPSSSVPRAGKPEPQASPPLPNSTASDISGFKGYVGEPSATQPSQGHVLVNFLDKSKTGTEVVLNITLGEKQAKAVMEDWRQDEDGSKRYFFTILKDWQLWSDGGTEIAIQVPSGAKFSFDALRERRVSGRFKIVGYTGPHQGIFTHLIRFVGDSN